MKKAFNTTKYSHFVLLPEVAFKREPDGSMRAGIGSISFGSYTDKAGVFGTTGVAVQYVVSRDDRGRDKGKFFTLSQSHNAFIVNETDQDIYKKTMFDFIASSPWCEGSPNGKYIIDENGDRKQIDVKYRLMNSEADAEIALEATLNRSKAQLSAGEIDAQTLLEVAAIGIAYHGEPDKTMRHKVVEWAGKRPNDYFEVLNSGDRLIRALIRKGISDNILTLKDPLIYWGNTLLGTDEDGAVKTLVDDKDRLSALQEKVNLKAKVEVAPKPKKKN
jgi:hypothetical protein